MNEKESLFIKEQHIILEHLWFACTLSIKGILFYKKCAWDSFKYNYEQQCWWHLMQRTKRGEVALHGGASWMTAEKRTDLASPGQALGDVWSVNYPFRF